MRLLYVAQGHPRQEADDCSMFESMDVKWFSTGHYSQNHSPGILPTLHHHASEDVIKEFAHCKGSTDVHSQPNGPIGKGYTQYTNNKYVHNIWKFTSNFLANFDIVLFNHFTENLENNWGMLRELGIPSAIKVFGMHPMNWENPIRKFKQQGLYVIRNSPTEDKKYKANFAGVDIVIRGSSIVSDQVLSGWIGNIKQVVTFTNHIAGDQLRHQGYVGTHNMLNNTYPMKLYGSQNHNYGLSSGFLTQEEKINTLRNSRVALCTGTRNANNTYSFVEAWVMGIPQIVFGPKLWTAPYCEILDLMKHGYDGFIVNTPKEAVKYIHMLMEDDDLAQTISKRSREKALKIYGYDVLKQKWRQAFQEITDQKLPPPKTNSQNKN